VVEDDYLGLLRQPEASAGQSDPVAEPPVDAALLLLPGQQPVLRTALQALAAPIPARTQVETQLLDELARHRLRHVLHEDLDELVGIGLT
jgi:hypothetical protein